MAATLSSSPRPETANAKHIAECNIHLERILTEWDKIKSKPEIVDPFKILGVGYDVTSNDILVAFGAVARKVHPDTNRTNTEINPSRCNEAIKAALWARDKALIEIDTGKMKERKASATEVDPANSQMGSVARQVADDARNAAGNGNSMAVNNASQSAGGSSPASTRFTAGGAGHGHGANHGGSGAGRGGGGGNMPHGAGAADDSPNKIDLKNVGRRDALFGDPLHAFAYGCKQSVWQRGREALVEFKIGWKFCGVASRQLGHRVTQRDLHYAVAGRNDREYVESGNMFKSRDITLAIAAGRFIDQETLLRMTVRNDLQKRMRDTQAGLGNLDSEHIALIYDGLRLHRTTKTDGKFDVSANNVVWGGILKDVKNCDPTNPTHFTNGLATFEHEGTKMILTPEGVQTIKNVISSLTYEVANKIDHYDLDQLWGVLGTREDWSASSIKLAAGLASEVAYENGLVKGKFSLLLDVLETLLKGAQGWRA